MIFHSIHSFFSFHLKSDFISKLLKSNYQYTRSLTTEKNSSVLPINHPHTSSVDDKSRKSLTTQKFSIFFLSDNKDDNIHTEVDEAST